jgi:hypothetical protein
MSRQATEDSVPISTVEPRTGTEVIHTTHNFCDPTTWYSTSGRSADETLAGDVAGLVYGGARVNWIDMLHGKLFDEDALCADVAHGYAVEVKVDGVVKTPRLPFATSGGDYTVNYAAGTVTFASSQLGKTVAATYSYAVNSTWVLAPSDGMLLDVEATEAQFSQNCVLNDTVAFEVWVYNPADLPNKFKYDSTRYKRMTNFIDEALGSYPIIPAIGGAARGTGNEIYGFPFRYGTVRRIRSSVGAELRVRLEADLKFGGEHATATFYCTVRSESD